MSGLRLRTPRVLGLKGCLGAGHRSADTGKDPFKAGGMFERVDVPAIDPYTIMMIEPREFSKRGESQAHQAKLEQSTQLRRARVKQTTRARARRKTGKASKQTYA